MGKELNVEFGMRNAEIKGRGQGAEEFECGLRPVGDIGAYAPEGSGNGECGIFRLGI